MMWFKIDRGQICLLLCVTLTTLMTTVAQSPAASTDSNLTSPEYRLISKLMSRYNRIVRPVLNISHPVDVVLDIALSHVLDVDEKNEIITCILWMRQFWDDEFLRWEPDDYDGLNAVRIPSEKIWTPDIVLYNSAGDEFQLKRETMAVVTSTGSVSWYSPMKSVSHCAINIRYFPFDTQHCTLTFGSWTYTGTKLNLFNKSTVIDMTYFVENGEFEIVSTEVSRLVEVYPTSPDPYVSVSFRIDLRRKPNFYLYNLILPCVTIVSSILMQFFLPVESGEKITFGTTVLLALSVFVMILVENLPANSNNLPLASEFFVSMMVMSGISILMSIIVLRVHYRNRDQRLSPWIRYLFFVKSRPPTLTTKVSAPSGGELYDNSGYENGNISKNRNNGVLCDTNGALKKTTEYIPNPTTVVTNPETELWKTRRPSNSDVDFDEAGAHFNEHRIVAQRIDLFCSCLFSAVFLSYVLSVIVRFTDTTE